MTNYARPAARATVLAMIDIQERLYAALPVDSDFIRGAKLALRAAAVLQVPIVATEQYPKGLGKTIPEFAALLPPNVPVIEKTAFSCFGEPTFAEAIAAGGRQNICLIGVETHVCVQQTAMDALAKGYRVFVLSDAVLSRRSGDKSEALAYLRQAGVEITTSESFVFSLLENSRHPAFREISNLVK